MTALDSALRKSLERAVVRARDIAEDGARAALQTLAVSQPDAFPSMTKEQRDLRTALRAKAKNLGEGERGQGIAPLVEEIAYEQWHRLLFARFLAENRLLMHPLGGHLSIEECAELAPSEDADNGWDLAGRYAALMLPGIFRADDPAAQIRLAREYRSQLEGLVAGLPEEVFTSDDGLGWSYQFWQAKKKDEVNKAGHKIGARELAPVTQLFTEDYMVRFLLENSLGAWWAARHPASPLLQELEYLRFAEDGTPASGTFPGWPERAAEVTVIDPCCGSGHFLVGAFHLLRQMRMEEEGLDRAAAGDAVLRDNLFGLELDERCVQIASFALAMEAWKSGGHRPIPPPQVACTGIPVGGQLEDWLYLATDDENLRHTLAELHSLFRNASSLGSLIDPRSVVRNQGMFGPDWVKFSDTLERVPPGSGNGNALTDFVGEAVRAASLLLSLYTLVVTNVPYLGRSKQSEILGEFLGTHYPEGKDDLGTSFLQRIIGFLSESGTMAVVLPANWLTSSAYIRLRRRFLADIAVSTLVLLGEEAWQTFGIRGPRTMLLIAENHSPTFGEQFIGMDVSSAPGTAQIFVEKKIEILMNGQFATVRQSEQVQNPDSRILLREQRGLATLDRYARAVEGLSTGDSFRYVRFLWELDAMSPQWSYFQGSPDGAGQGGLDQVVFWESGTGRLQQDPQARIQGHYAWGKCAVLFGRIRRVEWAPYQGGLFDKSCVAVVPNREDLFPAVAAFCRDLSYPSAVREIDPRMQVATSSLVKVAFDLEHWQKVAEEMGPLPEPQSGDPTQWLFKGHPKYSTAPLQVAVARLLGYRWPAQLESDGLETHRDADGIVPLVPVRGETPAVERLRALLADAFGKEWSGATQERLLNDVGFAGSDLGAWLADGKGFFAQHAKLFHNRPFIWQIWDGARDGFSVLVNYHKLSPAALDKLIYTYLGDWINRQDQARQSDPTAEDRLIKARALKVKLEAIRNGEPPFDIYVRWKPLYEQSIGWGPDLNDGVRLNVRPFVEAGVLRARFSVNWNKDIGNNPAGSTARQYAAEAQQSAVNRNELLLN